ncbi:MAG: nitroreductase family protein [Roseiflexaceae bacterium]|nr:nitroreductase family protein [Roseiflexaceae bacterium]
MSVGEAIRTKRAVRAFTEQPVPDATMREILHAGRRSQSSKNSQPWQFIVITNRETLQALAQCGTYAGHLAGAAFAVALIAERGHEFDLGQAAAAMQLAAWEQGVGSCIAAMWEPERARPILGVPDQLAFDIAISFGYSAEVARTPRMDGRKTLEAIVRWERW